MITLAPREKQILVLVVRGLTGKEIAKHLYLSEDTIRSYLTRMRRKFKAGRMTIIATEAIRLGILVYNDESGQWDIDEEKQ